METYECSLLACATRSFPQGRTRVKGGRGKRVNLGRRLLAGQRSLGASPLVCAEVLLARLWKVLSGKNVLVAEALYQAEAAFAVRRHGIQVKYTRYITFFFIVDSLRSLRFLVSFFYSPSLSPLLTVYNF
ncbi:hypothetical protein ANTRET_LOCUS5894 [Anthophora retusa]